MTPKNTKKSDFYEGSIHNPEDRTKAIETVKQGLPVVLTFRSTFGIFGAGDHESFVKSVIEIKGQGRLGSPLAAIFSAEQVVPMLDKSKLKGNHWLTNVEEIKKRVSTLCFIRLPITKEAAKALPPSMVSYDTDGDPILQNWFPEGLPVEEITSKIKYPAVTSTNYHSEPEIIQAHEVAAFCTLTNIPLFLRDHTYPEHGVHGSYSIFRFHSQGVEAVREGNIPTKHFRYIFEEEIDFSNVVAAKHPQLEFPEELFAELSPAEAKKALIAYAEGRIDRNIDNVRKHIKA